MGKINTNSTKRHILAVLRSQQPSALRNAYLTKMAKVWKHDADMLGFLTSISSK